MLHIAIVNAVYPPEPVVSAQMGRDLADYLVASGAFVRVLCPYPSRPLGVEHAGCRATSCPHVASEAGVEVVRLPSFRAPQSRFVARMWESWNFGRHVCRYLKAQVSGVDVVYANTWPLFSQALVARYCAQRSIPLVLHIQDIYPEAMLKRLPASCRGIAAAPLREMDRRTCSQAVKLVVISENMRRVYLETRGLAPDKVSTILNWVDQDRFEHSPERSDACARYGVPEEPFTFLYLGNIGPVAGVENLIEAFHAAALKQAQLVIAGDGSSKAACVELAKRLGVSGVRYISDPSADNVPLLQSLGHVCLLPMRKGAGMSSIPSKLMAYLLSGKPVLTSVDAGSDTAHCIQEAECGWVGEPEQVDWLARKMTEVAALPSAVLEAMGQRGRSYGLKHFSKAEGVKRLAEVVLSAKAHPARA